MEHITEHNVAIAAPFTPKYGINNISKVKLEKTATAWRKTRLLLFFVTKLTWDCPRINEVNAGTKLKMRRGKIAESKLEPYK